VWPGHPVTVHWGLPDPAAVEGPETAKRSAFEMTAAALESWIAQLVALPLEDLTPEARRAALREIARGA
jgi:arsenate reductase